jgi:hypothetical protein
MQFPQRTGRGAGFLPILELRQLIERGEPVRVRVVT